MTSITNSRQDLPRNSNYDLCTLLRILISIIEREMFFSLVFTSRIKSQKKITKKLEKTRERNFFLGVMNDKNLLDLQIHLFSVSVWRSQLISFLAWRKRIIERSISIFSVSQHSRSKKAQIFLETKISVEFRKLGSVRFGSVQHGGFTAA